MKKKKIIFCISVVSIIVIIFLIKNYYNFSKTGNNIINKSADEIKKYILNMESYEATAKIIIKSNKNENTYLVKQKYFKENNLFKQEILEPSTIAGASFIYDGMNLKVENSKLNLSKMFENYNYIESNELSLISFVQNYKEDSNSKCFEEDGRVVLKTNVKEGNRYISDKELFINNEQGKVEKMVINDITQNTRIYILYNEIKINTLTKEEILAFSLETLESNI